MMMSLKEDRDVALDLVIARGLSVQHLREECQSQKEVIEAKSEELSILKAAYEEDKSHFIRAPELVSALQSLSTKIDEIKDVRAKEDRRSDEKKWKKMKRIFHEVKNVPRRRKRPLKAEEVKTAEKKKSSQRRCYRCREKGHEARDCVRGAVTSCNVASSSERKEDVVTMNCDELKQFCDMYVSFSDAQIRIVNGLPCVREKSTASNVTEYFSDENG